MRNSALPAIEYHQPETFRSRGVAAPFTTPLLAGTRVRAAVNQGIELVVPNPSGGRGIYVMKWPGVRAFCNVSVHDTVLYKQITGLERINPSTIRRAGLYVAQQGYAGRAAAAAAEAAGMRDQTQQTVTQARLLRDLLGQVEPSIGRIAELADRAQLQRHATAALHRFAPTLGYSPPQLEGAVTAVAGALGSVGFANDDRAARIPRLIDRLKDTYDSLLDWLTTEPENDIGGLGRTLAAILHAAADAAEAVLNVSRRVLSDPVALLKRWIKTPEDVLAVALRSDQLLDGWEWICLLWLNVSSTPARRAALLQMAQLLPVLPNELNVTATMPALHEAMSQVCRVTSQQDSWRSGSAAFALIQRNETLRAMSL